MRTRACLPAILALLLACCLDWSQALFFKSWKTGRGYGYGAQNYGYNGYGNYGYGNYAGGYGYNYPSYPAYSSYSYPSYPAYSYPHGGRRTSGQRKGRTYSEIQRVIKPDGYVGLGGSRFLPGGNRFSPLWG